MVSWLPLLLLLCQITRHHSTASSCLPPASTSTSKETVLTFVHSIEAAVNRTKVHLLASWAWHKIPLAWQTEEASDSSTFQEITGTNLASNVDEENQQQEQAEEEDQQQQEEKEKEEKEEEQQVQEQQEKQKIILRSVEVTTHTSPRALLAILNDVCVDKRDHVQCFALLREMTRHTSLHATTVGDEPSNAGGRAESLLLTVSVHGAGPVGLFMTNALLSQLGHQAVDVIVFETRVNQQTGRKVPYERQWLTSLELNDFTGVIDPRVSAIVHSLTTKGGDVSIPIAMLETLLLISSRDLGARFVLMDGGNDEAIDNIMCKVDLALDATGNKLSANAVERSTVVFQQEGLTNTMFQHPTLNHALTPPSIAFDKKHSRYSPIGNESHPFKLTLTKILDIPIDIVERLQNITTKVCDWSTCGQFFLFVGALPVDINSAVLIVGLRRHGARAFRRVLKNQPNGMPVSEIPLHLLDHVHTNFRFVLQFLRDACGKVCRVSSAFSVDPFLYSPALYSAESQPNWRRGRGISSVCTEGSSRQTTPWMRIGDSCWTGDPTLSTGLGKHLQMVHEVVDNLKKYVANGVAPLREY